MVVYGIADRGDVMISGGMIRWTDGMSAREAPLSAMPISSRETIPLADTTHHITVHGDTVYVVDSTGIVSFTGGAMARVVTQPDVSRVFVPDDNELSWTDTTGLSFFGAGGQRRSVYVDADAVLDLVATSGELYATTAGYYSVPPLGSLAYRSKLIRVDKGAASAIVLSDASDFADDFIDDGHFGAGDEYKSDGLYAIDGQLYWSIFLDTMSSDYDQRLVERRTASGDEQVLAPDKHRSKIWLYDGAFYWNSDNALWRAVPNGAPERVLDGVFYVETVADGYAYGYVPAIGGVGLDLRRIAL
jgi:hypothetical protein